VVDRRHILPGRRRSAVSGISLDQPTESLLAMISRPQRLAADRQIHSISAGSGDPPGADCSVLIIPPEAPGSNLGQNHTQITRWSHALRL
jgi:hypothetical protein